MTFTNKSDNARVIQVLKLDNQSRKFLKTMAAAKGITMSEYIEQVVYDNWTEFVETIKPNVKES